jgi:hypothetical protein
MATDYGIKIATPGVDAQTATAANLLMNMTYPIAKLDITKAASFQNITIAFNNDPPEPGVGLTNSTLIYSFPHGYSYVPQVWSMITEIVPPTSQTPYQTYNQDRMLLSVKTFEGVDSASIAVRTDATNVNIYVDKYRLSGVAGSLVPCVVKLRVYVFAQDITS